MFQLIDMTTSANPISRLQEYCQKNKKALPDYEDAVKMGPAHVNIFRGKTRPKRVCFACETQRTRRVSGETFLAYRRD